MLATVLAAAPTAAPEHWAAYNKTAEAITGDITFTPRRITFQNGAFLRLERVGPLPGFKTGMGQGESTLYRVTTPANPVLLHGNRLCGKAVTQIVVTREPPQPPFTPALTAVNVFARKEDCGLYNFEAK